MSEGYSFQTGKIPEFSTVDYVVFGLLLGLSAAVGPFYAIKDKIQKKENTTEFLLGGRSMSVFPVALSLTVTFLSALTILGNPAEMYNYNTMFMYLVLSMCLAMLGSGVIFVPFFYRLGVTSVFQYLEMRFDYSVRILGSLLLLVQSLIYMSFVLYAPSLALSAVTGLNLWGCVAGVGVVVTFYTAMGGMKAVLWADSIQFVVMIAGLLAVFIEGCKQTGGFPAAWEKAEERGRIVFDNFSFNPSTRHSFWSVVIGGGMMWTALFGVNQAQVQRCLSTASVKKAQIAIALNTPGLLIITIITCLIGIVMFAFYADCHPLNIGLIDTTDQLLPLFVMDIVGHLKGLPGVFVSCVFSGSLSSLSSALNAIATVAFKDFLQPYCCRKMSDSQATVLNKVLVVVFGCIAMGLVYLVSELGDVMQATISVYGIINGPFFGLFVLGMFFPWANKWGALSGCLTSLAFVCWIGIGAFVHKVSTAVKSPVCDSGCLWHLDNATTISCNATFLSATAGVAKSYEGIEQLYTISYLYYTAIGTVTVIAVALVVSFITGYTRPTTLDPRLVCPLFDTLFPCLPEFVLRPLRFGIDHKGKYENYTDSIEVNVANGKKTLTQNGDIINKKTGQYNMAFQHSEDFNTKL